MRTFLPSLARTLRQSVLVRLGLAMGTLASLTFVSIIISTVIADNGSGKAAAINLSGSMRMMSFRMLSEVQQAERRQRAIASIELFDRRLQSLERFVNSRSAHSDELQESCSLVTARWEAGIRPLVRAAAEGQGEAVQQLADEIPGFVAQIDRIVQLIEDDLERQIAFLRAAQFALLAIIVLLSVVTSWMLRRHLFVPLGELLKAARAVSQGSFSTRVGHVNEDELGRLGQAFNTMIGEIASMYGHLEEKVEAKTAELTRINQSLELLYRTSQQLAASDLTLEHIQAVLRDIERELDLGHSMVCISEHGALPAQPILGNLEAAELDALCGERDCAQCFEESQRPFAAQSAAPLAGGQRLVYVRLDDSEKMRGTLPIFLKNGEPLPREKARLVETVGHHVANALASMRRAEEKHRLAVLEERSVIARELHDSIAQSLSYLKIQVTRLEKKLDEPQQAQVIAEELKRGLNAAYRELRELITTFRLRIDERGFNAALQETVEEFTGKLGFPVGLVNELAGIALSGNEEMHVIRIIREALSNIERHAEANRADIRITHDPSGHRVSVRISDNGKGFDPADTPPEHYGVSIIQSRAQSLGGQIDIDSRMPGGTAVTLTFQPQKYRLAA